jgi:hypothetical protein
MADSSWKALQYKDLRQKAKGAMWGDNGGDVCRWFAKRSFDGLFPSGAWELGTRKPEMLEVAYG